MEKVDGKPAFLFREVAPFSRGSLPWGHLALHWHPLVRGVPGG